MPDETHPPVSPLPNDAEAFGNVPHSSESFRTLPKLSEAFGTLRHVSERKENHTLTVREAARMFEEAGVARTERSITNWCQPNKMGMARLDSYFDPNERRYFITPESVRLSIEEEKAKAAKGGELHSARPPAQETPIPEESSGRDRESSSFGKAPKDSEEVSELRKEIMDLRIANRGKDMFIEHLTKERTEFVDQLMERSRKVGELETRLLQLDAPDNSAGRNADSA